LLKEGQTSPKCQLPHCTESSPILIICHRLIPKADRKKIHEYIFREGVLVAKKDFNLPKHGDIDTKNLYVRAASIADLVTRH
jgi:hypothetical protein